MAVKITKKWIENNAFDGDKEWFMQHPEREVTVVLDKLIADGRLDFANWLITTHMTHYQNIRYATYEVEQVLPLFLKEHPNDKRPRLAIEAAARCLNDDSITTEDAAEAAARDAWDARDAAWNDKHGHAAAFAAEAAGWLSAGSSKHFMTGLCWEDVWLNVGSAIGDAKLEIQRKILAYGISLLKKEKP